MLRFSYNTELKRYEAQKMGLELDLLQNPNNIRAQENLEMVEKQIAWIKEKIEKGIDIGVKTL